MGEKARQFVRENFLITRHMREYLTLMLIMSADNVDGVQIR
jgi:trehalose synthase